MESIQLHNLLKLCFFISFLLRHLPPTSTGDTTIPIEALPTKSGYLTVNSTTGSAIFYAFYEAQSPLNSSLSQIPLLFWLQGGPGCSSMVGNFYELGPWRVSSSLAHNVEHLTLVPNPGSWNRIFGLVFLDNPIGVGFSVAATPDEIPRDQNGVAKHLFIAIRKFVASDPSFKTRPIYITGESYAGKYVPAIGYYILKRNAHLPVQNQVNLAGLAIGNGMTDPETQVATHAQNTYFSGLINAKQKTQLEKLQDEAIRLTKAGNYSDAADARNVLLRTLQSMTGLATLYDFRRLRPYQSSLVTKFLESVEVKAALGVRNVTQVFEECTDSVKAALHGDVMKSVRYMVDHLLAENSKVLLYQGQCDLRDGVVSVEAWMKKLKWEGISRFLEADREVWKVNGELAGYVQKWGSLSHVVVLGAGHFVPTDQGVNSQAMIEDWVLERGLFAKRLVGNVSPTDHIEKVPTSFSRGI